jgi:type IV pilus assembly protein PilA
LQGGIEGVQSVHVKIVKNKTIDEGGFNMFSTLKKRIKNEKGLSLVELLAVIVILAIVAAIAIPAIGNIINNSRDKGQISDALSIISGAKLAHIDGKCTAGVCDATVLKDFVDGKELPKDLKVSLDSSSKEWSITGYNFEIKDTEKAKEITSSGVTEKVLKKAVAE